MPQTAASEKVKLPGKDPDHPAPETQSSDSDLVISDSGVVDVDGRKPASVQEKRAAEDQEETGWRVPKQTNPGENEYLGELSNFLEVNCQSYPFLLGNRYYGQSAGPGMEHNQLTQGYTKAITDFRDTSCVDHPILYVLSHKTKIEEQSLTGLVTSNPAYKNNPSLPYR